MTSTKRFIVLAAAATILLPIVPSSSASAQAIHGVPVTLTAHNSTRDVEPGAGDFEWLATVAIPSTAKSWSISWSYHCTPKSPLAMFAFGYSIDNGPSWLNVPFVFGTSGSGVEHYTWKAPSVVLDVFEGGYPPCSWQLKVT